LREDRDSSFQGCQQRSQGGRAERLPEVTCGALGGRRLLHRVAIDRGRHERDAHTAEKRVGAHGGGQLETVHARHGDVGDQDVRTPVADQLESLPTSGCHSELVVTPTQRELDQPPDDRFVVTEDDPHP
jgi:hypothetical protein